MTSRAALHLVAAPEAAYDPLKENVNPARPTPSELAGKFLDMTVEIARKKDPGDPDRLDMFRDRNIRFIRNNRERFFTELIRIIQKRVSFAPERTRKSDRIAAFRMNVSELPLRFISQACRNLLIAALPPNTSIPDEQTAIALGELSDNELTGHIGTFDRYDRPWLFFTALYVAGKRKGIVAMYAPR